ncbi:MAG TPA: choice-of-anchor Q domain-containing protein, partial [Blastocatellia bacterium]|nr:choice-of-anchor Q domain-containing protein [Blastocatellia bacterium]
TIVFSGVTTVTLTSAELLIDKNLTINGGTNGVTVTRSSATQFRIFHIDVGVTASMSKLTITGGNPGSNQAGGVQNSGTLTMTDCAITGNTSIQGSGIQNDNSLTMTNCTISGNTSTGSPGTGGGLVSFGTTNNLTNCTISGNTASNDGGGIYIGGGTLSLTNCTVTNNNSGGSGDGMFLVGSGHVFKNSIVAANPGFNIVILSGGSISSTSANNLIGNTGTGGISNGVNGNIVTASSPLLGALGSNGGYVQTHALLPGSLAINAGTNTGAPSTDPRGIARPQQSTVDIGAYESRGFTMALSSGNNQSTQINTNFPNPLIVTVVSASSEPVDGGRVTFTGPNTGAGLSIVSTSVSIASGAATTGTISANGTGGSYTVSATAGGVSTGVNFSLTNTCTNPSISIPPANQTVCAGSTASFSVTATGTALTYQWQKNSTNISGATSSSYTTPVTTLADSGAVYTVIVSGACGTPVTSSNATLTVNGATITTQPVSQVICDGASATLSVTATGTNLSYQWRKGGSPISGATSSSYTIPAFGAANADSYDVVVTSTGCASVTSSAASLSLLGVTTMTNLMPLWGGRLNGTLFEVGTNGAPSTEGPGYAFDGTFSKSLIRYTANAGYVITPASCDPAGKIINQFRIYTANDFSDRDPASYAFYGTNATISGNGPFDATQFTLISSGSLALPSGRNTSTLDDANSQLVSFANTTTYKSFMLIFPTVKNAGAVLSTQIGEIKFYPENYQPTLNTTAASMTQGQSSTGTLIGAATSGTSQAANTLTVEVSSDGTNFSSTATLNGVTISNVAVAANGNVTANLMATCAATNANFTVRITNDQSQSITATLTVNVTAATPPTTAAAGSDQLLCATAPATLAANTPSVGTGAWSIVSGPSLLTSQLTSLTSPTPIFTPAGGVGTYTLRWTITGVCATSTDDVVLTYNANPTVANAGPDQTVCATSVTLAGNLSTVGTGAWSIISGAGGTITTPSSPTSGFTGVAGTTYTLRWTISNSPCTASTDDV